MAKKTKLYVTQVISVRLECTGPPGQEISFRVSNLYLNLLYNGESENRLRPGRTVRVCPEGPIGASPPPVDHNLVRHIHYLFVIIFPYYFTIFRRQNYGINVKIFITTEKIETYYC